MPTAKKLPSGSWRCLVMRDGVRKSFTVSDPSMRGKRECERLAAVWASSKRVCASQTLVKDAVESYIARREKSLSVTTLAAYKSLASHAYGDINSLRVDRLTQDILQEWITDYARTHSPKTCANAAGLLSSALAATGADYTVSLPKRQNLERYTPTDEDVQTLIASADPDTRKAIMLAAFATLRKGEVCALTRADVQDGIVTVNKSLAWDGYGYVLKAPKTPDSVRWVAIPASVSDALLDGTCAPTDRIVQCSPAALASRFRRLVKKAGLPHFRFHDLRAYAASVRHALGIPDQYIMADGGWKTDAVLKRVYRRAMDDKRREFSDVASRHFDKLV